MKKLIITGLLFSLISCVQPKEGTTVEHDNGLYNLTTYIIKEKNGCTYKYYSYYNGGITVVNLTKDSLEMEYMKSQIEINYKFYGE